MTAFTTSKGVKSRTGTERLYIVVNADTAEIMYRTDDRDRAISRAMKYSPFSVSQKFCRRGSFEAISVRDGSIIWSRKPSTPKAGNHA